MGIEILKTAKKTIGAKQTMKAIERGDVEVVFLASDCDEWIAMPILELCLERVIPVHRELTMQELGVAAHIKVGSAAVGVLK